jgi:hypothetical protein
MRFLKTLVALALGTGIASCAMPVEEQPEEHGISLETESVENFDERQTWELYQRYIAQGLDPCDPPPDPWHPFVKYGFCPSPVAADPVPSESFDE